MPVTNSWTSPAASGSLDLTAGVVVTEAVWDAMVSNFLVLGGTDGLTHTGNYTLTGDLTVSGGNVGVGQAPTTDRLIYMSASVTGNATGIGVDSLPVGSSTTTQEIAGFRAFPTTSAASYTCSLAVGFHAGNPVKGSGSTITQAFGLLVDTITVGSSTNYGVYVNTPSGGSSENVGVYVAGGGVKIIAGGLQVTAGGATVAAGGATISGTTNLISTATGNALVCDAFSNSSSDFAATFRNAAHTGLVSIRADGLQNNSIIAWNITSSRDVKDDIQPLTGALDILNSLQPYHYTRTDIPLEHREFGLIAEEVHEVLPEVVGYDPNGKPTGIRYENLIAPIIAAIQELSTRVDGMEKQ